MPAQMWSLLLLACVSTVDLGVEAELNSAPDEGAVPAVRELRVSSDVPTRLAVTLASTTRTRTLTFSSLATSRVVPILGFIPGEATEVTVTATSEVGDAESRSWTAAIPPLPERFPEVEVLALDADRVEPGWTLLDVKVPNSEAQYVVLLDDTAQPVWWWATEFEPGDCRFRESGALLCLGGGEAWEVDLLGRVVQRWGAAGAEGEGPLTVLSRGELSHEITPLADSFLALSWDTLQVDAFPWSYTTPAELEPATIADQHIVEFGWDGSEILDMPISAVLDTERIGFDSLDVVAGRYDWVHSNAVIRDPVGGDTIVSVRHQDVVFALKPGGELDWMLGTPSGWREPWASHLLSPVGSPFAWPYHQHAPELEADGTLVMFDNGFHGYTPYDEPVEAAPSRAVGYRVDAEARTVEQVFSFSDTSTGPLYSDALGDADLQPQTGNVLADFGFVAGESELTNAELGWGRRSVRLVEWSTTGEVVADTRLRSDGASEPEGWKTYRVERGWPWPAWGAEHGEWGAGE